MFMPNTSFKKIFYKEHFFLTYACLKGQCHEIFDPRFFASNNPPQCPDSWARAISNMASNLLPRSDRDHGSRIFLLEFPFNIYIFL
jgi:hypothetical protein